MVAGTDKPSSAGSIVIPKTSPTILVWPFMFITVAIFLMQLSQGASAGMQILYRIGMVACIAVTVLIVVGFLRERKQRITISDAGLRYADLPLVPTADIASIETSPDASAVTVHLRTGGAPLVWKLPLPLTEAEQQHLRDHTRSNR